MTHDGAAGTRVPVEQALATGRATLHAAGAEHPLLEASLLLAGLLGTTRATVLAGLAPPLDGDTAARFAQVLQRRIAGEPVAYLLGQREFYGLNVRVDARVLVPRPETELLVEQVVRHLARMRAHAPVVIDVGTGSGSIAIAVARSHADARVIGVDLSADALAVARDNVGRHQVAGRVALVHGNLLDWFGGQALAIAANLPYLRPDQANPSIAYEPALALYAGNDGLDAYGRLMPMLPRAVRPGGILVAEIDPSQQAAMEKLVDAATGNWPRRMVRDGAGQTRMLVVERPT